MKTLWHLPRNIVIGLISLYQKTLSPDHGPLKDMYPYGYCRHEPTCSMYAKQVLRERGFVVGMIKTAGRILTCHPWKRPSDEKIRKLLQNQRESV